MRKIALLVGVEHYRDPRITPPLFATANVFALEARLHGRCGFDEVRVLADNPGYDAPDLHNVLRVQEENGRVGIQNGLKDKTEQPVLYP